MESANIQYEENNSIFIKTEFREEAEDGLPEQDEDSDVLHTVDIRANFDLSLDTSTTSIKEDNIRNNPTSNLLDVKSLTQKLIHSFNSENCSDKELGPNVQTEKWGNDKFNYIGTQFLSCDYCQFQTHSKKFWRRHMLKHTEGFPPNMPDQHSTGISNTTNSTIDWVTHSFIDIKAGESNSPALSHPSPDLPQLSKKKHNIPINKYLSNPTKIHLTSSNMPDRHTSEHSSLNTKVEDSNAADLSQTSPGSALEYRTKSKISTNNEFCFPTNIHLISNMPDRQSTDLSSQVDGVVKWVEHSSVNKGEGSNIAIRSQPSHGLSLVCRNLRKIPINDLSNYTSEKPCNCEFCFYKTTKKTNLDEETVRDIQDSVFSCDICHCITYNKKYLELHMLIHAEANTLSCQSCKYTTKVKRRFSKHVIKHTNSKMLSCDLCNFVTHKKILLSEHQRMHNKTQERQFLCEYCAFQANTLCTLNKHLETHTNGNPNTCDKCHFKTNTKRNLYRHIVRCKMKKY